MPSSFTILYSRLRCFKHIFERFIYKRWQVGARCYVLANILSSAEKISACANLGGRNTSCSLCNGQNKHYTRLQSVMY